MACEYFSFFNISLDICLIIGSILCLPFCKVFTSHILTKSHNNVIKYKTIYDLYIP